MAFPICSFHEHFLTQFKIGFATHLGFLIDRTSSANERIGPYPEGGATSGACKGSRGVSTEA